MMSKKERKNLNGKVVSLELLHELASDNTILEISLGSSVSANMIHGVGTDVEREQETAERLSGKDTAGEQSSPAEYDQWEFAYIDGERIRVYV